MFFLLHDASFMRYSGLISCQFSVSRLSTLSRFLGQILEGPMCLKVYNERKNQENLEFRHEAVCVQPHFPWLMLTTAMLKCSECLIELYEHKKMLFFFLWNTFLMSRGNIYPYEDHMSKAEICL